MTGWNKQDMPTVTIDSKVKRVVSNVRNLPTPPIVFHQIQKVINDPNVSAEQIASILSEDPAMSVKVLRLTNSAFYGLSREVESVKHAVVIIGLEAIKNLVLSASVLDMFKGKSIDSDYQEKFWRHSLSTAFACRLIANKYRNNIMIDGDAAFSAGLLHDVGKMVLSCFLDEEHKQFKEARESNATSLDHEIEYELFGFTHADIGAYLGEQWKIPQKLTEAINDHHGVEEVSNDSAFSCVVYMANWLAKKTFYEADEAYKVGEPDQRILDFLGISDDDLNELFDLLREEYSHAETFMQLVGM